MQEYGNTISYDIREFAPGTGKHEGMAALIRSCALHRAAVGRQVLAPDILPAPVEPPGERRQHDERTGHHHRHEHQTDGSYAFTVKPRWDLSTPG